MNSVVILYFAITVNSYILEMAQVYPACTTIEVFSLNLKFIHYTSRTCYKSSLVENILLERRDNV